MIVGMSAEAAAGLAHWQTDLSRIRTYATLADGLQAVQREYSARKESAPRKGIS